MPVQIDLTELRTIDPRPGLRTCRVVAVGEHVYVRMCHPFGVQSACRLRQPAIGQGVLGHQLAQGVPEWLVARALHDWRLSLLRLPVK